MFTATLTSKGQITIPKEIRERLRLQAGHCVDFEIDAREKFLYCLATRTFDR